jgi:hypothetical protein
MPFYCGKRAASICIVLGSKTSSTYFSEYASGFFEPAALHLPAAPSPRNEGLLGQTPVFRRVRAAFLDGCDSTTEIVPVGPGPKDAATVRTLEKLSVLLRDEGRDQGSGLVVWNGHEYDIAVRTAIPLSVVHLESDLEILMELAQLSLEVIVRDQRMATTEHLTLSQVPVAREEPPVLAEHAVYQPLVGDILFIRRIVAEDAQPACETAEHGVGHETYDGRIGWLSVIHLANPAPLSGPAGIRLHG